MFQCSHVKCFVQIQIDYVEFLQEKMSTIYIRWISKTVFHSPFKRRFIFLLVWISMNGDWGKTKFFIIYPFEKKAQFFVHHLRGLYCSFFVFSTNWILGLGPVWQIVLKVLAWRNLKQYWSTGCHLKVSNVHLNINCQIQLQNMTFTVFCWCLWRSISFELYL